VVPYTATHKPKVGMTTPVIVDWKVRTEAVVSNASYSSITQVSSSGGGGGGSSKSGSR